MRESSRSVAGATTLPGMMEIHHFRLHNPTGLEGLVINVLDAHRTCLRRLRTRLRRTTASNVNYLKPEHGPGSIKIEGL